MSRIRIRNEAQLEESPANGFFYAPAALHCYGTRIELDGKEVQSVRAIRLNIDTDEIVKATVDVLACDSLDVEIGAEVRVVPLVIEPGILEVERSDDGKTQRIRFIREAP